MMIKSFILRIQPELLSEVFEWLPIDDDELSATASVSLVCKHFALIAEPLRLRSLTISSWNRLQEVLETLRLYEHRRAYVRELFLFDFPDDSIPNEPPEVCYSTSNDDFMNLLHQVSPTLRLLSFTMFHSFTLHYPALLHKLLLSPFPSLRSLSLRLLFLPPFRASDYASLSNTLPSLRTLHLSIKKRFRRAGSASSAEDHYVHYLASGVEGVTSSSDKNPSDAVEWNTEVHVVAKLIGALPRLENLMVSGLFDHYTFCTKLGVGPYTRPTGSNEDCYRPTVVAVTIPTSIQLPPNLKRMLLQQYISSDNGQPFSASNASGMTAEMVNEVPAMKGPVFLKSIPSPTREVWRMLARFGGSRAVGGSEVLGVFEMRTFGVLFDCVRAI